MLYAHCYFTFYFCFSHLAQRLNFLWQDKDLLLLVNYIRSIFCALRLTKSDPAIRRAQEFQARFYFPVLGTVRGRHTHCVLLQEASLVQDEWKPQSFDWIHHLCPLLPSIILDATFSPTAQAAASHFYWHPLIHLWSMCRYLQQSAYIDCGLYGEDIWTDGIFQSCLSSMAISSCSLLGLV